jgi:hypothetical protein
MLRRRGCRFDACRDDYLLPAVSTPRAHRNANHGEYSKPRMRRKCTLTDKTATIYYNIIVRGYPNFFGYETEMRGQEEGLMKVGFTCAWMLNCASGVAQCCKRGISRSS